MSAAAPVSAHRTAHPRLDPDRARAGDTQAWSESAADSVRETSPRALCPLSRCCMSLCVLLCWPLRARHELRGEEDDCMRSEPSVECGRESHVTGRFDRLCLVLHVFVRVLHSPSTLTTCRTTSDSEILHPTSRRTLRSVREQTEAEQSDVLGSRHTRRPSNKRGGECRRHGRAAVRDENECTAAHGPPPLELDRRSPAGPCSNGHVACCCAAVAVCAQVASSSTSSSAMATVCCSAIRATLPPSAPPNVRRTARCHSRESARAAPQRQCGRAIHPADCVTPRSRCSLC